jgi:tRNA nucleotidyltransferase (CCA-adding enzyme)
MKSKKLLDEIKIAKAFCYACSSYGAESYIRGFSGYSLELLVYHYGGFIKMLKGLLKIKEKEIIDLEKNYQPKKNALILMNSSKLDSPIILVDPTFKERNALAAISNETLKRFQKAAKKFLEKPSLNSFEREKTDIEKIKKEAQKKKQDFILIKITTNKQEGDIAGTKLQKFYKFFSKEMEKLFDIKKKGFNYNEGKSARFYIV